MQDPLQQLRDDLHQATEQAKANLRNVAQYQKLRDVFHIDLDDEHEATLDRSQKLTYIAHVVHIIDDLQQAYAEIEAAQKNFYRTQNTLEKQSDSPHIHTLSAGIQTELEELTNMQLTEHYTLNDYLAYLGAQGRKIDRPRQFFRHALAEVSAAHETLTNMTQRLQNTVTQLHHYTQSLDQLAPLQSRISKDIPQVPSSLTHDFKALLKRVQTLSAKDVKSLRGFAGQVSQLQTSYQRLQVRWDMVKQMEKFFHASIQLGSNTVRRSGRGGNKGLFGSFDGFGGGRSSGRSSSWSGGFSSSGSFRGSGSWGGSSRSGGW